MQVGRKSILEQRTRHSIIPPGLPATTVTRERLDRLCAELLDEHEALAIFAAAGSGKTVQAQLFARRFEWPLAWLTLDRAHGSPARLLSFLAAALKPYLNGPVALPEDLGQAETMAAAGDLAERIGSQRVLVVFDQCEYISEAPDSCAVLETFLDYLPNNARTLLLSRSELHISLGRLLLHGRAARLTDDDLALTLDEAVTLGRALRQQPDDLEQRWLAAKGWIAGVAFARSSTLGGEHPSRDFSSYLEHEVFEPLSPPEQQFLLETSILDSVSLRSATVLCGPESRQVWHRIEMLHLPATTSSDRSIVYHPCLRAFLRDRLESSDPVRLQHLQRRHADLLLHEGRYEEAIELLLDINAIDEASVAAERAVGTLIGHGDWEVLLRWIERFGRQRVEANAILLGAELAALRGARRLHECRARIQELEVEGRLAEVLDADPRILTHAAWAMLKRPTDGLALLDRYDGDRRAGGVRFLLEVLSGTSPVVPPRGQPWDENDRLVSWGLMVQGRIDDLVGMLPSADQWPPRTPFGTPHPLLGLVWRGELARCRQLFEQVPLDEKARVHTDLWHYLESWLLFAEGDVGTAAIVAERAVAYSRQTGFNFESVFQIAEAQALLGLGRFDEAMSLIEDSLSVCRSAGLLAYVEWGMAFLGKAQLLLGNDEQAVTELRASVNSMDRSRRYLMLPMAATFLAEAEARVGELERADAAARLAYDTARRMGSFFMLHLALQDFPRVLEGQRDRSTDRDWRHLGAGRTTSYPAARTTSTSTMVARLQPFGGDPHLLVNGQRIPMRRLKVLELVAFLAVYDAAGVEREKVNLQLFPDSDRQRGSNHFRQIVHQLRKTTGLSLQRGTEGRLHWDEGIIVLAADTEFERAVVEARSLVGAEKLERLCSALELLDGPYLVASDLEWAKSRRFDLDLLVEEAEMDVARLALESRDYQRARRFARRILDRNPYMEGAYRTLIEVELVAGSEPAALAMYRRSISALAELGLTPDNRTRELISRR
jgi:LuxR family transcriptional regulator, maltose regulon positive regulatory protein